MTTLIKNGLVVDGTGKAAYPADVVVDGGKIADILQGAHCMPQADRVIDAAGCLVTPGFIDCHSHSDTYLLLEPQAPSKIAQGVTTEVNGQCGGSAVPRYGEARLSSDWASMEYPAQDGTVQQGPTWRSMAEYRALFDAVRPAINSVQFVGHNTLRSSVMGYKGARASAEELAAMERLLARELDDGGWGLTTGLIYQPGKYADSAEVVALAKTAAVRGGLYATHMRSEGERIIEAIDEVLELVRATGIRAEISHLKTSGKSNWGKIDRVLEKIDSAVTAGELAGSDRYPYCAAGTDLDVVLPDWAGEGGLEKELKRLEDPVLRGRIIDEINASGRDWNDVMIGGTWCDATRQYCGKRVADLLGGRSAGEAVCEILLADRGRTGAFFFSMCEVNMRRILAMPWILPGSDASLRAPWGQLGRDHPHPRAYSTMPRFYRILRELGETRESAIRRMTALAAERFGIAGRGILAKGMAADIAVWRESEFRETATFEAPHSFCTGMKAVLVNGETGFCDGEFAKRGSGRFLERA